MSTQSPQTPAELSSRADADHVALAEHLARARPILVVSPPRSASTAFARALNQHSSVTRYFHEPCGLYSYEDTPLSVVIDELDGLETGALIKEMTFQFQELAVAECFFRHCASPTIFLARSPLLTIESRIRMVLTDLVQDSATPEAARERARAAIGSKNYVAVDDLLTEEVFPIYRTGWTDFAAQLELCRAQGLEYAIVETSRFRSDPEAQLRALCPRLGLEFEPEMTSWTSRSAHLPGALDRQANWYERVGKSTGVLPPTEHLLPLENFPARFQSHLPEALATYEQAVTDPRCL